MVDQIHSNMMGKLLEPDLTKATSKLTVTITAYAYDDNVEQLYVKTSWLVEGKQLFKLVDFLNVIDSGKN